MSGGINKIVLASNNQGKLREFDRMLDSLDLEVLPQGRFDCPEAVEDGLSFVENAIIKARNAAMHCSLPALADDSGIEVDALNGAPGIRSARYAGDNATDNQNVDKLLQTLADLPNEARSARFQCVIVYMRHAEDPTPIVCQAAWEGRILTARQGDNGFGYDPVFWVPEHACSAAQLDADRKNAMSHRGKALKLLLARLQA